MNKLACLCLATSLLPSLLCGTERADDSSDELVKLLPFVVNEETEGLDWHYAAAPGFEILALCDESLVRAFLEAQMKGSLFLPESLQVVRSTPVQVVLWGGKKSPLKPTNRVSYHKGGYDFGLNSQGWYVPNVIAATDRDFAYLSANFSALDFYEFAAIHLARLQLEESAPAAPAWLREGLVGLWGLFPGDLGIQVSTARNPVTGNPRALDMILLPRLLWPQVAPTAEIVSLKQFFESWERDGSETAHNDLRRAQAGLLLRWALFGPHMNKGFAPRFWGLVERARWHPMTEDAFKAVLGIDYREAEQELREFARRSRSESSYIATPQLSDDLPALAGFALRRATEGEIARLKGNFERLEMGRLKTTAPAVAAGYEAAARRTVARGLRKAPDDPKVHELAGLLEYETGHPDAARPHLDHAFVHNAAGTRALLALARMRLADMRIGLPADGRLSAEALDRVLTPLFAARDRKPPVVEVYQMIAEVWAQSAVPPTKRHLAVLHEGTQFFRDETDFIVAAIELHRRHGYTSEADALLTLGETWARDDDARARYAALRGNTSPATAELLSRQSRRGLNPKEK